MKAEIIATLRKGFYIEKSNLTAIEGKLFLVDKTGHCHMLESIEDFLASPIFRLNNPFLVSIFEEAKSIMIEYKKNNT